MICRDRSTSRLLCRMTRHSVHVKVDGRTYAGAYTVDRKVLTVATNYGKKSAQVGHHFKGRQFEATLILQAVSWYLRYPLSYRDIEELFLERGLEVDHSTLNRWVLAYAPLIERRL